MDGPSSGAGWVAWARSCRSRAWTASSPASRTASSAAFTRGCAERSSCADPRHGWYANGVSGNVLQRDPIYGQRPVAQGVVRRPGGGPRRLVERGGIVARRPAPHGRTAAGGRAQQAERAVEQRDPARHSDLGECAEPARGGGGRGKTSTTLAN